jgi:uncharacterized protein YjbI with pentapeptide repeats
MLWLAVAIPVAAVIIYLLIWYGPDVIARHDIGNATGPLRVLRLQQARDAARGRLLTLGAGLFAAGALVFTARNFALSREGQVTDRYTKAIEQLGSDKLDVRIGGIYALERLAHDSAGDHPTVMEVLAAFIREHSREEWLVPEPSVSSVRVHPFPRPDVQSALTVIGRRDVRRDRQRIDLTAAVLPGALLFGADLTRVRLVSADLSGAVIHTGAKLTDANLTNADLTGADLTGADLNTADLTAAILADAKLPGATLTAAVLTRADLTGADLHAADLTDAILADAKLTRANLSGVDLEGAILAHANLTGANLRSANLTRANLTGADLVDADLLRAKLAGAILAHANLTGAYCTSYRHVGPSRAGLLAEVLFPAADLTGALLSPDAVVPEGWQRGTDSGRLKRADSNSGEAAAN